MKTRKQKVIQMANRQDGLWAELKFNGHRLLVTDYRQARGIIAKLKPKFPGAQFRVRVPKD